MLSLSIFLALPAYFILPSGRNFHCLFPQVGQSEFAVQDVHCLLTPSVGHANETETKFA
jgi:hypothetical protein